MKKILKDDENRKEDLGGNGQPSSSKATSNEKKRETEGSSSESSKRKKTPSNVSPPKDLALEREEIPDSPIRSTSTASNNAEEDPEGTEKRIRSKQIPQKE